MLAAHAGAEVRVVDAGVRRDDLLKALLEDIRGEQAPAVRGAAVLSIRGGDFLFDSGQDISIGYENHDAETVDLYLEESFSFRVATPEASVALPA